jgi:starvation-inducible DNA-binding protein
VTSDREPCPRYPTHIGQSGQLEQFQWFIRAHLETPDGSLSTGSSRTEKTAAKRARKR